ncbi:hypothetical protein [Imhoffiella purpurea]|uniref:hypothetical protein n=1 Tax=Imhoffiella purpurea TaxID=1249627 RepID=UPI001E376AF9|nr:hypothetical protein [Imhoffiella purpurea]
MFSMIKEIKAIRKELKEIRDKQNEDFEDVKKKLGDHGKAVDELKKRFDKNDEAIDKIETRIHFFETTKMNGGQGEYRPASISFTPTGRAFVEPRSRWVPDHPYRK